MNYISKRKRAQQTVESSARKTGKEASKEVLKRTGNKTAAAIAKRRPDLFKQPADDPPTKRADEFPLISVLPKSDMQTVLGLMTMDLELAAMEKQIKLDRTDGKVKIHVIIESNDLTGAGGLRWGQIAVYDQGIVSRPSCKLEDFIKALLETGMVTADLIDECRAAATKPGKEFLDLKVTDLSKPNSNDKDGNN